MAFFDKLKNGLKKTKESIFGKVDSLFKKFIRIDEDLLDELEELLIMADTGSCFCRGNNRTPARTHQIRSYKRRGKSKGSFEKHPD